MGRRGKHANILTMGRAYEGGYGTAANPKQIRIDLMSELDPTRDHCLVMTHDQARALGHELLHLAGDER